MVVIGGCPIEEMIAVMTEVWIENGILIEVAISGLLDEVGIEVEANAVVMGAGWAVGTHAHLLPPITDLLLKEEVFVLGADQGPSRIIGFLPLDSIETHSQMFL